MKLIDEARTLKNCPLKQNEVTHAYLAKDGSHIILEVIFGNDLFIIPGLYDWWYAHNGWFTSGEPGEEDKPGIFMFFEIVDDSPVFNENFTEQLLANKGVDFYTAYSTHEEVIADYNVIM